MIANLQYNNNLKFKVMKTKQYNFRENGLKSKEFEILK
jgi:hypothetical protein